MRLIIIGLLFIGSCFGASCNPTDQSGCAADCGNTVGSFTPIALPNTGWTQGNTTIAGVSCIYGILYNSGLTCTNNTFGTTDYGCLDAFYIPGLSNYDQWWCWHGGAFTGGNREGCFGQGNNYKSPVMQLQALADTPNSKGVKGGFVIIEADYPVASPLGTNAFPTNWQQMKCAEAFYEANLGVSGTGFPGTLNNVRLIYGPSAGGPLAWWQANTTDNAYAYSCPTVAQVKPSGGYRSVSAWSPMSFGLPSGNATIDNCTGCTTNALYNLLSNPSNVSTNALARTQDTALQASPYLLITNGNAANLTKFQMFQWGISDVLIEPVWAGGGNQPLTVSSYAALATPIPFVVEMLLGGHEADLTTIPYAASVNDARTFLTSPVATVGPIY